MPGIDSPSKLIVQANGSGATFIDSEPVSPKTINANGNAAQVQRKFNGTAAWFDGSDGRITIPDSSDWTFAGDFTIEMFVMMGSVSGNRTLWCHGTDSNNYASFGYDPGAGGFRFVLGVGTLQVDVTGTYSPAINVWYHLAIRRSGNVWTVWVDGVQQGTTTVAYSYPNWTQAMSLGQLYIDADYNQELLGWLKEVRISNVARTITVPTTQYTSDANTLLLLHLDNPYATSPIGPAIYFDGTGDYLTLADSNDWDFGTGDFTVEYWVRYRTLTTDQTYIDIGSFSAGVMIQQSNSLGINVYVQNVDKGYFGAFIPVVDRWYHIAVSRNGTDLRLFVDGVQNGSTATSSETIAVTQGVTIGARQATTNPINAWFKNIRVSNTSRYVSAFTPSQSLFIPDSNTKLLIRGDENNGDTTFVDSETSPKTVTTFGNTVINYVEDYRATIFKDDGNTGHKPYAPPTLRAKVDFLAPFGSGVGIFDGTGDYLDVADSADWDFGTGDFTLECFVRFYSLGGGTFPILIDNGDFQNGVRLRYDASSQFSVSILNTAYTFAYVAVTQNWIHVAFSRIGSTIRCFANGVLLGSTSDSSNITGLTKGVAIAGPVVGSAESGSQYHLDGYLDNARISNSGRYSATFNPPEEFTNALGFMSFFLDM